MNICGSRKYPQSAYQGQRDLPNYLQQKGKPYNLPQSLLSLLVVLEKE